MTAAFANWTVPARSAIVSTAVGWAPRMPPPVGACSESRTVSGPSTSMSATMGTAKVRVDWPGMNVSVPVRSPPDPGGGPKSGAAAGGAVALPGSMA